MPMQIHKNEDVSTDLDIGADDLSNVNKAITGLQETVNERLTVVENKSADFSKFADRLAKIEMKLNRPAVITKSIDNDDDQGKVEMKSFTTFIRKGREALDSTETKSLRVSDDTAGGYLAPDQFSAEVDKNLVQFSPVRSAARVGSTAAGKVIIPRRTGRPTGQWVGETEDRTATESAYGQVEITINEMTCWVPVSNQLLEDSALNIANEVAFDIAEEFGHMEGEAFINGDGVKRPLGLMSDGDITSTNSGSATDIGVDGLIDLLYDLKPYYRARGVWMMNGATIAKIRQLQFAAGGYVWQPSIAAGQPETLLGRPILECKDMPDVEAGAFPIMFGDFASAFRIYDRVGLSIIRDPYTELTNGVTRFHARRRVGARVVRPEAVRKLKVAA